MRNFAIRLRRIAPFLVGAAAFILWAAVADMQAPSGSLQRATPATGEAPLG